MATGSATSAEGSPQADAWEAIDPETRARLPFLGPEDFMIGTTPEQREDWARAMATLERAERFRAT
ncbi:MULTISPECIES: hypothetical protein [unclassified Streptomyces]|uniref:hypothetical protein n=1 Tax=unclassified Streptomyces TaxID=2593676 RepID=UPI002E2BE904|nr:hypothetical protein [Streptomyces sp. NBC_00223]